MTAKISANTELEHIAAAGATAAWNIANFVLDGCGSTHARADLLRFGNIGKEAWFLYASASNPVSSGRTANAGIATRQNQHLPKVDSDQINTKGPQTDPGTNKCAKVAKRAVSEAAAARATGTKHKSVCKFDDVFKGGRRDVNERTRHEFHKSDD